MAESEQNSAGIEPELQQFSGEATELENEAEQQDLVTDGPEKENPAELESEKQNSHGDDIANQIVNGNESEKNLSVNESEHNIPAGEADPDNAVEQSEHDLVGTDTDQNLAVDGQNEVGVVSENVHHEAKQETGEEKKWPGWPGESVFRMLVPGQKVGNIIGRKGEYIKKIVEETKARVKILDGPPGTSERAVQIAFFIKLRINHQCDLKFEASKMEISIEHYKC